MISIFISTVDLFKFDNSTIDIKERDPLDGKLNLNNSITNFHHKISLEENQN